MKKVFWILLVLIVSGCVEHNPDSRNGKVGNYVVFGAYHGMCAGDRCVRMFLLNETGLFEDASKQYPNNKIAYQGDFSIDRSTEWENVKEIPMQVPDALINSEDHVLGCPDCSDGGGLYFETKVGEQIRYWHIDKQRMPAGLEEFVALLNEKLQLLQ